MEGLEGTKVVTAREMARVENLAYDAGASDEAFMENAARGIAEEAAFFVLDEELEKGVTLLVGKGNNGGDAFVAGRHLLDKGFTVRAFHLFPTEECSPLCQKHKGRFIEKGGKVCDVRAQEDLVLPGEGILLDGLVGTGFQGKAEGLLAACIEKANQSGLPILAIDIPSGLNGDTGAVESVAIRATRTVFLGLPKIGFFVGEGFDYVGDLAQVDFGIDQKFLEHAKAEAFLTDEETLAALVPRAARTRHKYQAGYVVGVGASPSMPGAAMLTSLAALRTGAGIVRLFYPEGIEEELAAAPLEVIKEAWDLSDDRRICEEAKRAKAFFIGPGMGRSKEAKKAFCRLIEKITLPTVIDADALFFLSEEPTVDLPDTTILTPHHAEMQRLLPAGAGDLLLGCRQMADQRAITLVLKGAPTFIFHPFTKPLIIPHGDPGMATAGTGDVLTGVIAALLAQELPPREAAALGVLLHAIAGEEAAFEKGSHSMIASDLLAALPDAFTLLEGLR